MSDNQSSEQEFDELVSSFLEGELKPDQAARFRELLASDSAHRDAYRRQAVLHALLLWRRGSTVSRDVGAICPAVMASLLEELEQQLERQSAELSKEQAKNEAAQAEFHRQRDEWERRRRNRPGEPIVIPWSVVYGVAGSIAMAVIYLAYSIISQLSPQQPREVVRAAAAMETIATIDDAVDVEWSDPRQPTYFGAPLDAGGYGLERGIVKLKFASGATALIEAPAKFALVSAKCARVSQGKLFAAVPEQAIGFTVETPQATLVDLGTEFGINVVQDGEASEFHVIDGVVELGVTTTSTEDTEVVSTTRHRRLTAGKAVQVDKHGAVASIALRTADFHRTTPRLTRVQEVVAASFDARLLDKDGDGRGDQVEDFSQPSAGVIGASAPADYEPLVGVGEKNNPALADADARRYWLEFEFTDAQLEKVSKASLVDSVQLAVALAKVANVGNLQVDLYGIHDAGKAQGGQGGYEAPGERLAAAALDATTPRDQPTMIDVTDFVKQQLRKGESRLAFRLQAVGDRVPNSDGVHNTYVVHTNHTKLPALSPRLLVTARKYERQPETLP